MNLLNEILKLLPSSIDRSVIDNVFEEQFGLDGELTVGPNIIEEHTNLTASPASHIFRFLSTPTVDGVLVHQSRMAGFHRKLGERRELNPIGRDIKDELMGEYT